MHSPFIGAYWQSRRESEEQCAQRIGDLLSRIKIHPGFEEWFTKGSSPTAARRSPVPTAAKEIQSLLKANNRDTDGAPFPELGFDLDLWNGSSVSLSISCGADFPGIWNSVVIDFANMSEPTKADLERLRSLLEAIVQAWDPDEAVVASSDTSSEGGEGASIHEKGWFSYSKAGGLIKN